LEKCEKKLYWGKKLDYEKICKFLCGGKTLNWEKITTLIFFILSRRLLLLGCRGVAGGCQSPLGPWF
jgi:hypothetical protein